MYGNCAQSKRVASLMGHLTNAPFSIPITKPRTLILLFSRTCYLLESTL